MKKICIMLILLISGISLVLAAPCGDVNSDGTTNIIDALMTAQYYVGLNPEGFDKEAGDVNGDGMVNIIDALQMAQYYVGLMDHFEGCSTTPTLPPESETVFAVNCGGSAYTASDGTEYSADKGFVGGSTYENGKIVSGTIDTTIYSTERYGTSTYSVSLPNGQYKVTLHFAENYHTSSGMRVFNVLMEGTEAVSNLDIFAKVGGNAAYVTENQVKVSDGQINIEFVTVTENALVNGIKIDMLSLSGDPVADFSVTPQNLITLDDTVTVDASASYDLDGTITKYQVEFGDGYAASGAVTTHKYTNEGPYTITVTVTDNEGKTGTKSKTIMVYGDVPECTETRPGSTPSGSLVQVDRALWASGVPSTANMYIYVPGAPSSKPAIVVSCHSCGNSAKGQFNNNQKMRAAADKYGFIMVFPDNSQNNCWDVGSNASLTHDGGGDTQAVAQMTQYALDTYNGDSERVYIMGGSSGAMMTQAMLAVYPNLFKAGSARAGVPAGSWAVGYNASNQWSGSSSSGNVIKTAEEWGAIVRAMYPSYEGPRPRVQLFHGMADSIISYKNLGEAVKEWTNVLGLNASPSYEDTITTSYNYNRQFWKDGCGYVVFETWSSPGNGHSMTYEEDAILAFFGLEEFRCVDPWVIECQGR